MMYAMLTLFVKLWNDFNLHSCVAPKVLRILFVALGRKSLCTTAAERYDIKFNTLVTRSIYHKSRKFHYVIYRIFKKLRCL